MRGFQSASPPPICIEPLTCVPNAAALAQRGIDSGLRVLAPGESLKCRIVMRVDSEAPPQTM